MSLGLARSCLSTLGAATLVTVVSAVGTVGQENGEGDGTFPRPPEVALEGGSKAGGGESAVTIKGPALPPQPAEGKGRLSIAFSGNRRWCTWADDRLIKPPLRKELQAANRDAVYTFGYQFTIAAVARSAPHVTLLLFESPVVRTASMRQGAKLKAQARAAPPPPSVMTDEQRRKPVPMIQSPLALVPYWEGQRRCAQVGEAFDFDLDPGVYDVYIAFDLLIRDGGWVHRSIGYLTDVAVEAGRQALVEGVVNFGSGGRREVDLERSSLVTPHAAGGAGDP